MLARAMEAACAETGSPCFKTSMSRGTTVASHSSQGFRRARPHPLVLVAQGLDQAGCRRLTDVHESQDRAVSNSTALVPQATDKAGNRRGTLFAQREKGQGGGLPNHWVLVLEGLGQSRNRGGRTGTDLGQGSDRGEPNDFIRMFDRHGQGLDEFLVRDSLCLDRLGRL